MSINWDFNIYRKVRKDGIEELARKALLQCQHLLRKKGLSEDDVDYRIEELRTESVCGLSYHIEKMQTELGEGPHWDNSPYSLGEIVFVDYADEQREVEIKALLYNRNWDGKTQYEVHGEDFELIVPETSLRKLKTERVRRVERIKRVKRIERTRKTKSIKRGGFFSE